MNDDIVIYTPNLDEKQRTPIINKKTYNPSEIDVIIPSISGNLLITDDNKYLITDNNDYLTYG